MTAPVPNPALIPPGGVGGATPIASPAAPQSAQQPAAPAKLFADVLAEQTQGPKFSRHALERVQRRGIDLNAATVQRLSGGIARAASKGSRDSVVFVDGTAFVVSVASNTVITAVGSEHMREHVFTNIDSAVIA